MEETEGVLSVCLHLSAPYIFWVGWIAVREKLGCLVVWLEDMKARAALTCWRGMDLFSVCFQSLLCSKFVITARGVPKLPCLFLTVCSGLVCACVCTSIPVYLCGDLMFFQVLALPALKQCPAVPPISALILMLLGRKSGTAGSCRVVINLEMISALPKAWASNQCNMLELIFLPSLLSWLVS